MPSISNSFWVRSRGFSPTRATCCRVSTATSPTTNCSVWEPVARREANSVLTLFKSRRRGPGSSRAVRTAYGQNGDAAQLSRLGQAHGFATA